MKKILYIAFAVVVFATVSCTNNSMDMPQTPDTSVQALSLKFTCGDMETRATVDGVNNENLIKRIDYFIFPYNEEKKVEDDTEYAYHGVFTPTDDGLAGTYTTDPIQTGALSQIFPNGADSAVVFAVANYVDKYGSNPELTATTTIPEDITTWKGLHDLEVGATFFKNGGSGYGLRWPHAMATNEDGLFFVMTADSVAIGLKTTGSNAIEAEIPLARLASKVTVNFSYENCTEVIGGETITWVPITGEESETRVYLSNAIEHATLGGPLTRPLVGESEDGTTKPAGNGKRDVFEYSYDYIAKLPSGVTPYYYTYPISMEEGDDNQPYLKFVLLWYGYKGYGTTEQKKYKQKEVYYKILLPRETITKPNCIYEYSVKVNIVGSDKEVKIIGDQYIVKNWTSKDPVSSNVATGRYISLDIPKDEYDMYVDEIDISFVSSGEVQVKVDSIFQYNYSSVTTGKDLFMLNNAVVASNSLRDNKGIARGTAGDNVIKGWVTIPAESSYLKISHTMDNRLTVKNSANQDVKNPAFDMAPYIFKVTLHLEAAGEDTSFDRTIRITQYPSMYVTSKHSDGYVFVNEYSNQGSGNRVCRDDDNNILGNFANRQGSLDGTGNNSNDNNYLISTSILSGGNYVIGDPRSKTVNNLSYLALTNYKPASANGTEEVVSPLFIVGSAYGSVNSPEYLVDKAAAEKRCAAYQENGYPAGRWRLPTAAEIKFMATLSKYSFIPSLFNFNNQYGYWSANGKVRGDGSGEPYIDTSASATSGGGIRCVYDAWYWGKEPYQEGATSWLGYHD